jgi:hypothetical protein
VLAFYAMVALVSQTCKMVSIVLQDVSHLEPIQFGCFENACLVLG